MIKRTLLVLAAGILLAFNSCSESGIDPKKIEPGRRDYLWTVDTLDIYYPTYKIWGSSPTDVWSINESDLYNSIWHYDGNRWSTDGVFRFIAPRAIFGFSSNNVFLGGIDGKIWQFDGYNWKQIAQLTKEGTDFVTFQNIWGESPNDFYAVGGGPDESGYYNISAISHFTDNKWTILNTEGLIGIVERLYKNKPDGKFYLQTYRVGGGQYSDSTLIYEYTHGRYNKIYVSIEEKGRQADISLINGEVYFILGSEIAKRINGQFQTILHVYNPNFYQRIWGRNSKDIFLLMTDGLVHYNGSDMQYLFYFSQPEAKPWTQIYGAALFEKDVFFTVYEPPTHLKLIYHGKLKE